MRITRIYTDQTLRYPGDATLGKDAARHLVTVLRLKPGDAVCLFNGQGGEYRGEIIIADAKQVVVRTTDYNPENRQSPLKTLLGIGISRGERFEWVLQKATELGVSEIFPLYTERTEVKLKGDREDKKHNRWQQVIVSACEQSGRNLLPVLHQPQPLNDWLGIDADIKLLLHHRSDQTLKTLANLRPETAALLIGSEGGLSENEICQGSEKGFQSLTLGARILRTETAPLAVLSILQGLWGDF
ncbi:MAG: 16S rRNA (uracil(1498)-N(3))-methyltransferase [Porticoccaceae bacterium]